MFENKTISRIEKMLDSAVDGTFCEDDFDESRISRLESKWKRYLYSSELAKKQLDETKSCLEGLISDISHQTKTPIANLKLYSELLGERMHNMPDATDMDIKLIEQITSQAEKLDFLVTSLTKMSRLESDIIKVNPEKRDVSILVKDVVDSMRFVAAKKNINIIIDEANINDGIEAVYDLKWTGEALSNIIDNAIKYSSDNSTIVVSIILYEMYVAVSVKDEGKGISEEDTARIFERFYRSEENSDIEGVGIGLYLVREILKRENGYIKVKSELGKGSEFKMYLWKG